jgi:histidyl-tRNA synthetase
MFKGALPGFRDFYPQEFAERAHIMATWREVARRYAFVEYDGPPLEPLELYTRKSGEEIVGQLYNFVDKGGRDVALRPEMTPTVARMVAARANALRKPVRWFSMPQLFRYERQQKGRLREHYQLNVDIFGVAEVTADAELVACAVDIMRAFGLTSNDVVVRVSDRRILQAYLESLGVPAESVPGVYGVIDKLERQPAQVSAEKLAALGVPAAAIEPIVRIAEVDFDAIATRLRGSTATPIVEEFGDFLRYVPTLLGGDARGCASISRSCAVWRTTPASCSSCSTARASSARSVAVVGTTRCSNRSAAPTCRHSDSAWATWCSASCCAPRG